MQKAKSEGELLTGSDKFSGFNFNRSSPAHAAHPRQGPELVRARLTKITTLADQGLKFEARAASADLLFEFQALIVAHEDIASRFIDVLKRCDATALLRRFMAAAYGDARRHKIAPPDTSAPKRHRKQPSDLATQDH
jgi:hypothetical protein